MLCCVCVVASLVFSLGFCEWAIHTPWYLVAQYFSIAIFSDKKNIPFLYEVVAIENAGSKNSARKSSKPNRLGPILCGLEKADQKRKMAFFDLDFSIRRKKLSYAIGF